MPVAGGPPKPSKGSLRRLGRLIGRGNGFLLRLCGRHFTCPRCGRSDPASARPDFRIALDPVLALRHVLPGPPNTILLQRRGRGTSSRAICRDPLGMRFLSIHPSCGVDSAADQHTTERHDRDGSRNWLAACGRSGLWPWRNLSFDPWLNAGSGVGAPGRLRTIAPLFNFRANSSLVERCAARRRVWFAQTAMISVSSALARTYRDGPCRRAT